MPGLMLLFVGLAAARDVLLYQGDPAVAVRAAAGALGGSETLVPIRTTEIPGGDHPVVLRSTARFCRAEGAGNAAVRDQMSRAEGHLAYQRTAEARVVLDGAVAALACLPEPIEASLAGRLFFLRGVVALRDGDAATADRSFRLASSFQPGIAWDARFPPDPTGTFARATVLAAASISVPIGLGPGSAAWVDGRAPAPGGALVLAPGSHYVQVLDNGRAHTALLSVSGDLPVAIVTPGWLAAVDLDGLDVAGRRALAEVARGAFPDDTIYAVAAGRVWRVDSVWREQAGGAAASRGCAEPRRCVGHALLGAGAGLLVGGGAAFGLAELRVGALAASPEGEDEEAYRERAGAQAEAARWLPVGGVLAGVGVVLAGVGLVVELPMDTRLAWTGVGLQAGWAF